MEKFNTTGGSKNGKGGVFKSAAHKLLTVGGGNKTNLKCSGVNNNTGAAQLKNLTNFLFSCEASVHKVCNLTNFNKLANGTKLKACYKTATTFETLAQDCLDDVIDDSTDDACSCWQKKSLANATAAAKLCKFNKEAAAYGVALRHCRNAFAKCRKYEDAVSEIISVCTTSASSLKKSVGIFFFLFINLSHYYFIISGCRSPQKCRKGEESQKRGEDPVNKNWENEEIQP